MNKTGDSPETPQSNNIKYPTQDDVVEKLGNVMDQFTRSFEASARRWELVVYPSMIAFIILAA